MNEYAGKSEEQKKSLRIFRGAMEESRDYVKPYFQKFLRMWNLYAGVMPPELESTYSQIMLWFAYATVDQELTQAVRGIMTNPEWLSLRALDPNYERSTSIAKKWLRYQMEDVQQFQRFGLSSIQSAYIFGKGYRWYKYVNQEKVRYIQKPNVGMMGMIDPANPFQTVEEKRTYGCITASNLNIFNGFPSPNGCFINTPEHLSDERLDYFIANTFPTKNWIQAEVKKGNFDKNEAAALFTTREFGSEMENDPSQEFKQEILDAKGTWRSFSAPDWIRRIGGEIDNKKLNPRYRVAYMFEPDHWRIVAEDRFLLYDGEPLLNWTPIASFDCSTTSTDFYGTGIIEPVEDLLISMIMNYNLRLDHLIGKFHPTKYLPKELVEDVGGDLRRFDTKPFNYIPYEHRIFRNGLSGLIYNESGEELGQQAFLEQSQMKEYLEDIIGQRGGGAYANSPASIGVPMIGQELARSLLRAINIDQTGIKDSAEITLRMGGKYIQEDELVRTGEGGIPWENINFDAITDGYGVEIAGARKLIEAEEMFKKMLSTAPLLLRDPEIKGQLEMKAQLLKSGGWQNIDSILAGDSGAPASPAEMLMAQPKGEPSMPGGVPSFQNDARSTMNRNSVGSSGKMVAAGAAGI